MSRYTEGSVVLDPRNNTWSYRWLENGHRRSARVGTLAEYPTKPDAVRAAEYHRIEANRLKSVVKPEEVTFGYVANRYMIDRMPDRNTTRASYRNMLTNHIIPRWGPVRLTDVKPVDIESWLKGNSLAGKTRANLKGCLGRVLDYAMVLGVYETQRNPIELVRLKKTRRRKAPTVLTPEQVQKLLSYLAEPVKTMVTLAVCLGIRRGEVVGLQWQDFNWLDKTVTIQRAVVDGVEGEVKTVYSNKPLPLDEAIYGLVVKLWETRRLQHPMSWVFGGKKPYNPGWINERYIKTAGEKAGLGLIGWHTLRHTYRSLLDKAGTSVGVQRDLMRHSSVAMTMEYGGALPEDQRKANSAVVRMVIQ